jgi:hypothetical protein
MTLAAATPHVMLATTIVSPAARGRRDTDQRSRGWCTTHHARGGDRLTEVALGVLGSVDEQAEHG